VSRDRLLLVAADLSLVAAGVMLGVWAAFLVPLRLFGHIEGLSDVIALVGTFGLGWLGASGTGTVVASVLPGLGLLPVAIAAGGNGPGGDLVVPGKLGDDPGVGVVGTLFVFAGLAGLVAAVVLATRQTRRQLRS
jgi:hypothetical protein